ncbi:MAG: PIN domain-containing protein [Candidatus Aenigmatarchaeota archaeon]
MNNIFVIDTYAWIEYLISSDSGESVKKIVENTSNQIYTNIVTLSEVMSKVNRENMDVKIAFDAVTKTSMIFNIDNQFAFDVGALHAEQRRKIKDIGLADIFVLLTAKRLNASIVTGDPHFKGFKNVVFI